MPSLPFCSKFEIEFHIKHPKVSKIHNTVIFNVSSSHIPVKTSHILFIYFYFFSLFFLYLWIRCYKWSVAGCYFASFAQKKVIKCYGNNVSRTPTNTNWYTYPSIRTEYDFIDSCHIHFCSYSHSLCVWVWMWVYDICIVCQYV